MFPCRWQTKHAGLSHGGFRESTPREAERPCRLDEQGGSEASLLLFRWCRPGPRTSCPLPRARRICAWPLLGVSPPAGVRCAGGGLRRAVSRLGAQVSLLCPEGLLCAFPCGSGPPVLPSVLSAFLVFTCLQQTTVLGGSFRAPGCPQGGWWLLWGAVFPVLRFHRAPTRSSVRSVPRHWVSTWTRHAWTQSQPSRLPCCLRYRTWCCFPSLRPTWAGGVPSALLCADGPSYCQAVPQKLLHEMQEGFFSVGVWGSCVKRACIPRDSPGGPRGVQRRRRWGLSWWGPVAGVSGLWSRWSSAA